MALHMHISRTPEYSTKYTYSKQATEWEAKVITRGYYRLMLCQGETFESRKQLSNSKHPIAIERDTFPIILTVTTKTTPTTNMANTHFIINLACMQQHYSHDLPDCPNTDVVVSNPPEASRRRPKMKIQRRLPYDRHDGYRNTSQWVGK